MPQTVDARGLACPLPALRARAALAGVPAGGELIVLADDPEAPLDLAALAADAGCGFTRRERAGHWELTLVRPPAPAPPPR
jgi:tRNA 2-thiouridine synthesizing protein A